MDLAITPLGDDKRPPVALNERMDRETAYHAVLLTRQTVSNPPPDPPKDAIVEELVREWELEQTPLQRRARFRLIHGGQQGAGRPSAA